MESTSTSQAMAKTSSPRQAVGAAFQRDSRDRHDDARRRTYCQNDARQESVLGDEALLPDRAGGDRHHGDEAGTDSGRGNPAADRPQSRRKHDNHADEPIARPTQCRGWTRSPMNAPARSVVYERLQPD